MGWKMGMPLPTRSGMGVNIYIPFPSLNPAGMGAGFPTIPKEQTTFLIRPSMGLVVTLIGR